MNRVGIVLTLSCALGAAGCRSSEPVPSQGGNGPSCMSRIDAQLLEDLKRIPQDKSPARSGLADLVIPKTKEDYLKLNRMAILAVTAFSSRDGELPIRKVHFIPEPGKQLNLLPRIFPQDEVKVMPPQSQSYRFGKFRQDLYFFIPIRFLTEKGLVTAELQPQGKLIQLLKTPISVNLSYSIHGLDAIEDPNRAPDPELTIKLIDENYCIFSNPQAC